MKKKICSSLNFECLGNQSHCTPEGTILSVVLDANNEMKLIRITGNGDRVQVTGDIEQITNQLEQSQKEVETGKQTRRF